MERSRRARVTRARSRNRSKAAWGVLLLGLLAALAVVGGSLLNFSGAGKRPGSQRMIRALHFLVPR